MRNRFCENLLLTSCLGWQVREEDIRPRQRRRRVQDEVEDSIEVRYRLKLQAQSRADHLNLFEPGFNEHDTERARANSLRSCDAGRYWESSQASITTCRTPARSQCARHLELSVSSFLQEDKEDLRAASESPSALPAASPAASPASPADDASPADAGGDGGYEEGDDGIMPTEEELPRSAAKRPAKKSPKCVQ